MVLSTQESTSKYYLSYGDGKDDTIAGRGNDVVKCMQRAAMLCVLHSCEL